MNLSRLEFLDFGYNIFSLAKSVTVQKQISANNGLLAYAYSDSVYACAKTVKPIIYIIYGLVFLNIVLGLINRYSIVVIEMIGVLQISYFALCLTGQQRSPLLVELAELKYTNGYNYNFGFSNQSQIPLNLKLSSISTSILDNLNFSLILIAVPAVIALIYCILSAFRENQKKKYKSIAKYLIG